MKKEVLNKYFIRVIGKELPFSIKINKVDELFDFINKSMCFKDKKFDYLILHNYIKEIDANNKKEKKLKGKKIKKELKEYIYLIQKHLQHKTIKIRKKRKKQI